MHLARKVDLEGRGVVRTVREGERDTGDRSTGARCFQQANALHVQRRAVGIDRFAGGQAEELQRFRIEPDLVAGNRSNERRVEDEIACRPRIVVHPCHSLADDDAVLGHVKPHAEVVMRQPGRHVGRSARNFREESQQQGNQTQRHSRQRSAGVMRIRSVERRIVSNPVCLKNVRCELSGVAKSQFDLRNRNTVTVAAVVETC